MTQIPLGFRLVFKSPILIHRGHVIQNRRGKIGGQRFVTSSPTVGVKPRLIRAILRHDAVNYGFAGGNLPNFSQRLVTSSPTVEVKIAFLGNMTVCVFHAQVAGHES